MMGVGVGVGLAAGGLAGVRRVRRRCFWAPREKLKHSAINKSAKSRFMNHPFKSELKNKRLIPRIDAGLERLVSYRP
jgi:hypothetical protein